MIWESAKSAKQVVLDGISVEIDKSDSTLTAVIFTDSSGNKVRVRYESYCMKLEIPSTPKKIEKFEVSGSVRGLAVSEIFDSSYDADRRKEELTDRLHESDFDLQVGKKEVEEEFLF